MKEEWLEDTDIITYLRQQLETVVDEVTMADFDGIDGTSSSTELPFDYRGGYVGYLGYEVRHDSQQEREAIQKTVPQAGVMGEFFYNIL